MADPTTQMLIEQNKALISALTAIADHLRPKTQAEVEAAQEQMRQARVAQIRGKPADLTLIKTIPRCTSPFTKSTFDVEIQNGVVSRLLNYKEPDGAFKKISDGGLYAGEMVEEGKLGRDGKPQEIVTYQQWRYENFYQKDNRDYVQKPCPDFLAATSKIESAPPAKTG